MAASSVVTEAREAAHKVKEKLEQQKPRVEEAKQGVEKHAFSIATGLAIGSILFSLLLFNRKSKENAIFVGLWAPTLLSLATLYMLAAPGRHEKD